MESPYRLRTHNPLTEEDGHPNCKVRQCPCNLVEVEQDAALHSSSMVFIVMGALGRCCQESSAKCQDL
jgi:hypothetical protein